MIDLYRKQVAAMVIQLAKDDPALVKRVIHELRDAGQIEAGDLEYLEALANRWIRIAEENRRKALR